MPDRRDWTIRKYTDFDRLAKPPGMGRLDAIEELIEMAYAMKGIPLPPPLPRS